MVSSQGSGIEYLMGILHKQYELDELLDHAQLPTTATATKSTMSVSERKFCICRSTDGSGFMILCENCDDWFHGRCINITEEFAQGIRSYYCTMCIANNPILKIRYKRSAVKNAGSYREDDNSENGDVANDEPPSTARMYYVGDILDKKVDYGRVKYLIKWADYDDSENSWEFATNLTSCQYMVDRFERRLKRRENGEATSSSEEEEDVSDRPEDDSGSSGSSEDSEPSSPDDVEEGTDDRNGDDEDEPGDDDGGASGDDEDESESDEDDDDDDGDGDDGDDGDGEEESVEDDDHDANAGSEQAPGTYPVLNELPEGREPTEVLLTLPVKAGGLAYLIECKNKEEEIEPHFVYANFFREQYPQLVIEFYEKHVQLTEFSDSDDSESFFGENGDTPESGSESNESGDEGNESGGESNESGGEGNESGVSGGESNESGGEGNESGGEENESGGEGNESGGESNEPGGVEDALEIENVVVNGHLSPKRKLEESVSSSENSGSSSIDVSSSVASDDSSDDEILAEKKARLSQPQE